MSIANGTRIQAPVVSPDGQNVLYLDNSFVMTVVSINGGPSMQLSAAGRGGATWLDDDTIVVGLLGGPPGKGLRLINARDPKAPETVLTSVDTAAGEAAYLWPQMLPDGHDVLFTITADRGGLDRAQLAVFDMRTKQKKAILRGGSGARYVAPPRTARHSADGADGYLVYVARRALWAIPFDVDRLEIRGRARKLPAPLVTDEFGSGQFATAGGTLAYVDAANAAADRRSIVWIDWSGKATPVGPPGPYSQVRVSPDETQMAVVTLENNARGIRILDLRRQVSTLLRLDPVVVIGYPVWLPDGQQIVFQGQVTGETVSMWRVRVDGTGTPERLLTSPNPQMATSVSADGYVVFHEARAQSGSGLDILRMKLDATRQVTPLLQTRDWEIGGEISPDGRWIAYECCSESQIDIWVSPYPNTDAGRWQVSSGGGGYVAWSKASDQLFFVARDGSLMKVAVDPRASAWRVLSPPTRVLAVGPPTTEGDTHFDISRDGQRVLTLKSTDSDASRPPKIVFVRNWLEELASSAK